MERRPAPRPDPDFLALVERQEWGKLELYIGSAAGTGKTYRMINEAHDLRRRGIDVVIGFVETHGRVETVVQLRDIEMVPRQKIEYRGVTLEEMDVDGVIARRPQVAVVDELAHSNVPSARHPMMPAHTRFTARWSRAMHSPLLLLALFLLLACGDSRTPAERGPDEPLAARLAGTWDMKLRLERPLSLATDAGSLPRSVSGTLALLESRSGRHIFEQMDRATHVGVYDIDLGALGFPSMDAGIVPGVAARKVARGSASGEDSIYILMNPETPRHFLRLAATFRGDSVTGTWIAESFLGGGGTFTLRRRGVAPPER